MTQKKNILVFPCGSEMALELYRSVKHSTHFHLIGANSIDDHGRFVYEDYVGDVPFITHPDFLPTIKRIIAERKIDAVYPAVDTAIEILKTNEEELGCKVIASSAQTTQICLSKSKTYKELQGVIPLPKIYDTAKQVTTYPIFVKPDIGHSAIGTKKVSDYEDLMIQLEENPSLLILEYLPGDEYTVDCFTDKNGKLLFAGARQRARISNGISVNTIPVEDDREFQTFAEKINAAISFRGAWFFQVKRDIHGKLVLMEIASRFGGSSALFRAQGINFALMSLFDAFDIPVSVLRNTYHLEMDRAWDNCFKIDLSFNEVFVDFDDCLYLEKHSVNTDLVAFLYKCLNKDIRITLLSKHDDIHLEPLNELLKRLRLEQLFDRIIHIKQTDEKYRYIDNLNAIFIDDSFAERAAVHNHLHIPVFNLDMINLLN